MYFETLSVFDRRVCELHSAESLVTVKGFRSCETMLAIQWEGCFFSDTVVHILNYPCQIFKNRTIPCDSLLLSFLT